MPPTRRCCTVADEATGRCGSCAHWGRADPNGWQGFYTLWQQDDESDDAFEAREVATQAVYGDCGGVEGNPRDDYERVIEPPVAFTYDGSNYMAGLRTQAQFGCVLWEPREVAVESTS